MLYADLVASTALVDSRIKPFAAEIYKAFLYCSARIIHAEGGQVTAYDGDRVMAVFIGSTPCTDAVRASLKMHWAVDNIIQARMKAFYSSETYVVKHVCGVDYSPMMVAKTGVRGANDLVWVGRAANHAAKLTEVKGRTTWITDAVYDRMLEPARMGGDPKRNMWSPYTWTEFNNGRIYGSDWHWSLT